MRNREFKPVVKSHIHGLFTVGVLFLCLLFCNQVKAQTLPKPVITCVNVEDNGEVTLSWDAVADPGGLFNAYHVFYATNAGGPYTEIPGTNLTNRVTNTTYTHTGIDASAQILYYYIVANQDLPSSSPNSETWNTIRITLVNNNDGMIIVNWNKPLFPVPSSYNVYSRNSETGTWNQIAANLSEESYLDTIITDSCGKEINIDYKVESPAGCFSSVGSEKGLTDVIRPNNVKINFVTVDTATGFVTIEWQMNKAKDTQGYSLFRKNQDKWIITEVDGVTTVRYTDKTVNANNEMLIYGLEAYDYCSGNELGILHSTVFLGSELDVCAQEVKLTWGKDEDTDKLGRPYGWANKIKNFEIWVRENTGAARLLGSTDQNTKEFYHRNLVKGIKYTYTVKAIAQEGGFTSLSNKKEVSLDNIEYLGKIAISTATVTGPSEITIIGNANLDVPGKGFGVLRSENANGPFELVATINQPNSNPITIKDNKVYPFERSYFYKMVAMDDCGNQISSSETEIAKTILLQEENNPEETILSFSWNNYETWTYGIAEYQIYRNTGNEYLLIATLSPDENFFEDVLAGSGETVFSDKICYVVKAIQASPLANDVGYSNSNTLCFTFSTLEWIPNAFNVNSHIETNRTFKPVINFFNLDTYSLRIYNRWGEKLFETNNPSEGWNGKSNDKDSPQGVYIYEINYQQSTIGKANIRKTGTVTLVR